MTHVYEGGCMIGRARDDIYRMADLKGRKVGLNIIKMDWSRFQEEFGIGDDAPLPIVPSSGWVREECLLVYELPWSKVS
jgi:hypothetical protein